MTDTQELIKRLEQEAERYEALARVRRETIESIVRYCTLGAEIQVHSDPAVPNDTMIVLGPEPRDPDKEREVMVVTGIGG